MTPPRRAYIDWLRGVGVLLMIEAHAFDAWTAAEDRSGPLYANAMVLAGSAAPIFLFLAGLSSMLAIGARQSKGASGADAVSAARRRGWQILGLAFLFRLQSWILGGGIAPPSSMLKVDILNIMGLMMVVCALLWAAGRDRRSRTVLFFAAATAVTMATPLVRSTPLLGGLPDPVESYFRPTGVRGTFALFPWAGFVLAGAGVGLILDAARTAAAERRAHLWLAGGGLAVAAAAYGASFLPPVYPNTHFWTTSPTFFLLRVGVLLTCIPLAYAWDRRRRRAPVARWSPLVELGKASLFVYWIHVELAYGWISDPLHKRFSLGEMTAAYLVFAASMLGLVLLKRELSKPLMTRRLASPS